MSFTLSACTDIRKEKVNIFFPLPAPPRSLAALSSLLESVFRQEESALKQERGLTDTRRCEPFKISRISRYSEESQGWQELHSIAEVQMDDQLYVFRSHTTPDDISDEREVPEARSSRFFNPASAAPAGRTAESAPRAAVERATGEMSTPRAHRGHHQPRHQSHPREDPAAAGALVGAAPPPPAGSGAQDFFYREVPPAKRVEYLFHVGDPERRLELSAGALDSILRAAGIQSLTADVVRSVHAAFASRAAPRPAMTLDDFQRFAMEFPQVVNVAFQRIRGEESEQAMRRAHMESQRAVAQGEQRVSELQRALAAAERELGELRGRGDELQEGLRTLEEAKRPEVRRAEEQLLQKEVSVFQCKEQLRREALEYERLAVERNEQQRSVASRLESYARATNSNNVTGILPSYTSEKW